MSAMVSQITGVSIAYSTVCSGADKSSVSLAFVGGIRRWPANSPHKGPVTRTMFPFDDVIIPRNSLTRKVFHLRQQSRDARIVLWEQKPRHKIPFLAKCYDSSGKHFTDTLRTFLPQKTNVIALSWTLTGLFWNDWFVQSFRWENCIYLAMMSIMINPCRPISF